MIFVADSQVERTEANLESLDNLAINLNEQGFELEKLPYVIQYNKRDLPNVIPVDEMEKTLNPRKVPSYVAVASDGSGVFETLKDVAKLVIMELKKKA